MTTNTGKTAGLGGFFSVSMWLSFLAIGLVGCPAEEAEAPTAVIVSIWMAPEVQAQVSGLRVTVRGAASEAELAATREVRYRNTWDLPSYPVRVAVTPSQGDASRFFLVTATGVAGETSVVEGQVASNYSSGQQRHVNLVLAADCIGEFCAGLDTCWAGGCEDSLVPIASLSTSQVVPEGYDDGSLDGSVPDDGSAAACEDDMRYCEADGQCIGESDCCSAEDCRAGGEHETVRCELGMCQYACAAGFSRSTETESCEREESQVCDDEMQLCAATQQCIPASACCTSADCSGAEANQVGTCAEGGCSYSCKAGYRVAESGTGCVIDDGTSCASPMRYCDATDSCIAATECCVAGECTGGQGNQIGTCQAGQCVYACASGMRFCTASQQCIANSACCASSECSDGVGGQVGACRAGQCVYACESGERFCTASQQCIANSACCASSECSDGVGGQVGSCRAGQCVYSCPSGTHLCEGSSQCVSDSTCCSSSECTAGVGGQEGTCQDGQCVYSCPSGQRFCDNSNLCVSEFNGCCVVDECAPGALVGSGVITTCEAGSCRYSCPTGRTLCPEQYMCITSSQCCLDSDCTDAVGGQTAICSTGLCTYF